MSVEKYTITKECAPYTTLPNHVLKNLRDPAALGIWCYLSSLPPAWEFYKDQIRSHFKIGRDKLKKIFSVLKKHNLIKLKSSRSESGQIIGWDIHVKNGNDFVSENNFNQKTENPSSGGFHQKTENPAGGKSAPINKRKTINTKHIILEKPNFVLPEWIPKQAWQDFEDHRADSKSKLTDRARIILVKKLEKLKTAGEDLTEVLETSVANGWTGIFPVKKFRQGLSNANKRKTNAGTFFDTCKSALEGTKYDKTTDPLSDFYDQKLIN